MRGHGRSVPGYRYGTRAGCSLRGEVGGELEEAFEEPSAAVDGDRGRASPGLERALAAAVAVAEEEEEPLYGRTYLPRKFKIGFSLPWDNCIDVMAQDLGFIAVPDRGRVIGFNVYVGGGMGMTYNKPATFPALGKPLAWVDGEQAVPVATARARPWVNIPARAPADTASAKSFQKRRYR